MEAYFRYRMRASERVHFSLKMTSRKINVKFVCTRQIITSCSLKTNSFNIDEGYICATWGIS